MAALLNNIQPSPTKRQVDDVVTTLKNLEKKIVISTDKIVDAINQLKETIIQERQNNEKHQ